MPKPEFCSVCVHGNRAAIEAAVQGHVPLRTIADQHGVSKTTLLRHKAHTRPLAPPASHPPMAPEHDRALLMDLLRQALPGARREIALCQELLVEAPPGMHPEIAGVLRQCQVRLARLLAELARGQGVRQRLGVPHRYKYR